MRVTTAFSRLLRLPGVWVRSVSFEADRVVDTVALRRRCLRCLSLNPPHNLAESVDRGIGDLDRW